VNTYWERYAAPIKNDSNEIINSIYLTRSIPKIKKLAKELEEVEKQLRSKRQKREEASSALTGLFKKRDEDKRVIQKNIWFNVKEQLFPSLERLKKTNLDERQRICLEILEANLHDLTTSFSRQMNQLPLSLTPAKMQLKNFVRNGKNKKRDSTVVESFPNSINSHSKSIRDKIGIRNKKRNLRTVLISRINGQKNTYLTIT